MSFVEKVYTSIFGFLFFVSFILPSAVIILGGR